MLRWPRSLPIALPRTLALLAVASVCLAAVPWLAGSGLVGRYYSFNLRSEPPKLVSFDPALLAEDAGVRVDRFEYHRFGAEWAGWLRVPARAIYDFDVRANGTWWMTVNGTPVSAGGGDAAASVVLPHGLVPVRIGYERGRDSAGNPAGPLLDVWWGPRRGARARLEAPALVPTRLAGVLQPRVPWLAPAVRPLLWFALPCVWTVVFFLHGAWWVWRPIVAHVRAIGDPVERRALAGVLAGGFVMTATAFWWGLPAGWAIDELWPQTISAGARRLFSNGWYFWYPPLHYYVLAVLAAPFEAGAWLGVTDMLDPRVFPTLFGVNRLVTVVMVVAALFLVYRCGLEVHGRRRWAIAGAALGALMPTVAYYGKTANVDGPYVFWVLWALLHYLRAVRHGGARDYLLYAAIAALAVTTKDQAYGFFVLPTLHLAALRVACSPGQTWTRRIGATLTDPVLWKAAAIGTGVFLAVHNVVFNWTGFLGHLGLITGPGGIAYRSFEPTVAGQAGLMASSVTWWAWAMGWPSLAAAAIGFVVLLRQTPRMAVALLLPLVSYYASFIAVILYHHDRFFIAFTLLLAVGGGVALGWSLERDRPRAVRLLALAVVVFLAWRAFSVNVLMLTDSRYTVERWLADHAGGRLVAFVGPFEFLPRGRGLHATWPAADWAFVTGTRPAFVVINAEYSRRDWGPQPAGDFYRRLRGGADGYRLAFAYKHHAPLALLGRSPLFTDEHENAFTNIDKINPRIEVYERTDRGPEVPP